MITKRPSAARGHANHGWLDTFHTFSFADYHDPAWMGFSALRVLNQDVVAPGRGFGTHGHADMEIVTWVLEGALQHRDSMGNGSIIKPGDAQLMSAGTGVTHSEFNASTTGPAELLQMWVLPQRRGLTPRYDQKAFPDAELAGKLRLIASDDGRDGSLVIGQDVSLYAGRLGPGDTSTHRFAPGRRGWLHVARGSVRVDGETFGPGDGAAITNVEAVRLEGTDPADVVLFDLPRSTPTSRPIPHTRSTRS
jgi:redox-sensitive bicupin YhaK (pirin superfamily)